MMRSAAAVLLLISLVQARAAPEAGSSAGSVTPDAAPPSQAGIQTVVVEVPEPRFVAPTNRDRIGRIWAPVYINEQGPFRLVFDTGASRSAVIPAVVAALGMTPNETRRLRLRGVTGTATVASIRVHSLRAGDVLLQPATLPVIADAFGGAQGILGTDGLGDRRIRIEFLRDRIEIARSHNERPGPGFITIPMERSHGRLPVVDARIGGVPIKAIIDTGAQSTIGNSALSNALRKRRDEQPTVDSIVGATLDMQEGAGRMAPPIALGGGILIRQAHVTFGDMHIFEHWGFRSQPALLIGMDALGLLDTLIIDYRRAELQIRLVGR
ncbi:MAG: aspartyl protease family protein [Gammaproteobacteria bacterium]|nr:aspartyl protease family protein [Gammaproteobacteria bacterium]